MAVPLLALIPAVSSLLGGVLDLLTGDKKAQAEALLKELDAAAMAQQGQIEINKIEAQHQSIFVSGWRPAFGWIGATACLFDWIIRPYLPLIWKECPPLPPMSSDLMWVVVTGLLGLGGLRTIEKGKGVAK